MCSRPRLERCGNHGGDGNRVTAWKTAARNTPPGGVGSPRRRVCPTMTAGQAGGGSHSSSECRWTFTPFPPSALRVPPGLYVSDHLAPLALRTAFPSSLVGRDSHDYCGASVTLGLAALR